MNIHVTCFPIDQKFMAELGIYNNSKVHEEDLGSILLSLVGAGYIQISSFVGQFDDGEQRLSFHCKE